MHDPSTCLRALCVSSLLLLLGGCGPAPGGASGGAGRGPNLPPGTLAQVASPPHPVISALLLDPASSPGAVAIRIANPTSEPVDLGGYSLTDEPAAKSKTLRTRGQRGRRDLLLPEDQPRHTRLAPGQEIWIARDAAAFRTEFGQPPDFELDDDVRFTANDPGVPDVSYLGPRSKRGNWLALPNTGAGGVALVAPDGRVADLVLFNLGGRKKVDPARPDQSRLRRWEDALDLPSGALWRGEPLLPATNLFLPSPPFSARGRIWARNRHDRGRLLPDTDSAADWNAGASTVGLGQTVVHRVWYPGQSSFVSQRHEEEAEVIVTAAPESNLAGLVQAFAAARRSIRVHVYYFTHGDIADALVAAVHRGVDVTVAMEGSVVGLANGFYDEEREIARQIEAAGRERSGVPARGLGRVYWIRSDPGLGIDDRYTYDHSKYAIIDDRWIIIGSENYGSTGHPVSPNFGNRGWEIQLRTPEGRPPLGVVQDLLALWQDDVDPEHHRDIVRYDDAPATLDAKGRGRYGPPPPGTVLGDPHVVGRYVPREPLSETVREVVGAELVVSPDTSLNERGGMLGAIARAQRQILVEHLSLATHWGGRRSGSNETTPNVLLQALLEAAQRGVQVRILLDCAAGSCTRPDARWDSNPEDNDDVYDQVNELARRTGLDLEARLLDTTSDDWLDDSEDHGLEKIHDKGLVIDGRTTLVASINGVENSFKGNREVGVLVDSPRVARFYQTLFAYDWTTILQPEGVEVLPQATAGQEEALRRDAQSTGVVLGGLQPGLRYYLRVSALDDDAGDVENTRPPTPLGPHESALSEEVSGVASASGTIGLRWPRNRSECLEGDLAGYRIWYGTEPGPVDGTLLLPADATRRGLYSGREASQGPSPVTVAAGPGQPPQCRALLQAAAASAPAPQPVCTTLVNKIEQCQTARTAEGAAVFPQLAAALQPLGAAGSTAWRRKRAEMTRACARPAKDRTGFWREQREECTAAADCASLFTCLRRVEGERHRGLLPREREDGGGRASRGPTVGPGAAPGAGARPSRQDHQPDTAASPSPVGVEEDVP